MGSMRHLVLPSPDIMAAMSQLCVQLPRYSVTNYSNSKNETKVFEILEIIPKRFFVCLFGVDFARFLLKRKIPE